MFTSIKSSMMFFNCIKIKTNLLSIKLADFNIFRCKGFTHSETKKLNLSIQFGRNVLQTTNGCILFDAMHHFDPAANFIKNDQIILKLIEITNCDRYKHKVNICQIFSDLDLECVTHAESWSIEQIIFVLDIWYYNMYSIGCNHYKSEFFHRTSKQYLHKLRQLGTGPILQILFYFTCTKWSLAEHEEKSILRILLRELHHLSLAQASIFYKALIIGDCVARIEYGRYVRRICSHLHQNDLQTEPEIAVTDAIKIIRRLSLNVHNREIASLQLKLIPLVKTSSHYLLTHCAQLGVRQKVFNPLLLEAVIKRLMEFLRIEPQILRIKDVERSLLLIATYRLLDCVDIIAEYCTEVQSHLKQSLATKFPGDLVECIAHLATIGSVDPELIDWALRYYDNDVANHFNFDSNGAEHFLIIDSFAKINLANEYKGHRLTDTHCSTLKWKQLYENPIGFHHNMQMNFVNIFEANNQHVWLIAAAPHFNSPDFLFVYDKNQKKTVDIGVNPNKMGKIIRASHLYAGTDGDCLMPIAFVTYTHRSLLRDDGRKIATGRFMMKLKQLEMLGFNVVTWYLRADEWKCCSVGEMRQKLCNRLNRERIYILQE